MVAAPMKRPAISASFLSMPHTLPGLLAESVKDASGTIAVDATAQTVLAAPTSGLRSYLLFQNNSPNTMWLNFGVAATNAQPSIKLTAGASYENPPHFCPQGLLSVWGTTATDTFTLKYF